MDNNKETINDLEEDLNLEDFEEFEDESEDDIDVSEIEYTVFPLYKEHMSKIPDSVNPKNLVKMKKLYLYSPFNITSAYSPISGYQINMENIQGRFLTITATSDFQKNGNKRLAATLIKLKENIKSFEENVIKSNKNKEKNGYSPKNKNKNN